MLCVMVILVFYSATLFYSKRDVASSSAAASSAAASSSRSKIWQAEEVEEEVDLEGDEEEHVGDALAAAPDFKFRKAFGRDGEEMTMDQAQQLEAEARECRGMLPSAAGAGRDDAEEEKSVPAGKFAVEFFATCPRDQGLTHMNDTNRSQGSPEHQTAGEDQEAAGRVSFTAVLRCLKSPQQVWGWSAELVKGCVDVGAGTSTCLSCCTACRAMTGGSLLHLSCPDQADDVVVPGSLGISSCPAVLCPMAGSVVCLADAGGSPGVTKYRAAECATRAHPRSCRPV